MASLTRQHAQVSAARPKPPEVRWEAVWTTDPVSGQRRQRVFADEWAVRDQEGRRQLLRVLGAGLTDEAAARRLGTSLRTYRRRVAEVMAALEAGSASRPGCGLASSA